VNAPRFPRDYRATGSCAAPIARLSRTAVLAGHLCHGLVRETITVKMQIAEMQIAGACVER
jgi:hypothetical protein